MSQTPPSRNGIRQSLRSNPVVRGILWPVLAWRDSMATREEEAEERYFTQFFHEVEGGSLVVRIPSLQSSFEIDARSTLLKRILKRGNYEPELVEIVQRYQTGERDVIDIGANIGIFTVLMAKRLKPGKRVLAIEPTPNALKALRANIARNGVDQSVVVWNGVVMDKTGDFQLETIPGKEEYSSVFGTGKSSAAEYQHGQHLDAWMEHAGIAGAQSTTVKVPGETVDNLVESFKLDPGFIKMDAEGAEHLILNGATKTLQRSKPIVVCEAADILLGKSGTSAKALAELFTKQGYNVLDATNPKKPIGSFFNGTIVALPQ
jgi:FkbM family methyltransferase